MFLSTLRRRVHSFNLSNAGVLAGCSIGIKPKNGVSTSFEFCTVRTPINVLFFISDASSERSSAVYIWSSHYHWQLDQSACPKAIFRFLVYGPDSSVRCN